MDLNTTCRKIKQLKIQGAENVATTAIEALLSVANRSKSKEKLSFILELEKAKAKLFATRPTEPAMRNYLDYITSKAKKISRTETIKLIKQVLREKKQAKKDLIKNGIKLVKKKHTIFTHCHSSTVIDILKKVKPKVKNTETRPLFQGRQTAKDLAKVGIKVEHYTDAQARLALKDSDMMIIGADAITYNKVYNKVGSEMLAIIARTRRVPVYVACSLWKFDPHKEIIEERSPTEVWKAPKGVTVKNYAFEKIDFKHIKGIICEKGILRPKKFVKVARKMIS